MKLYTNPASPFARKARIIVRELKLVVEEIQVPREGLGDGFRTINPLGKIPVLVLDDGSTLFDSPVICEYLNEAGGGRFFPGKSLLRENTGHWRALTLQALGDGICDAAVARNYERLRPAELQSAAVIAKYMNAVNTGLDVLERTKFTDKVTIGEITVACALGYLDFRIPELGWRQTRPNLRDWYEKFAQYPSMQATWPAQLA
ncbi:glutathione S-transferase family protein [Rhizomicrobium electricum]|jgi:glutathione S-transferase|uniref:Glutathione S-transferase family protein n=1 Tax=Rhizomicrobium electricum TaxID=480070 RepID=A0ABN1EUL1_9PROT|nr:glutathione S-transferase family protein [Rhizomicrobium electricum]NIJ49599.1 glutathione S-transferase [Rhizomicrobium electricum]